jgi:hypothetical protein
MPPPPPSRPSPPAPPKSGRMCPACGTFIPAGRRLCSTCKLEAAKMDGYEAAKRAAQSRGFTGTKVQASRADIIRRAIRITTWVLVIAGIVYGGWSIYAWLHPPPRYLQYPNTAEGTVREFLNYVSAGDDKSLDKAYFLVADSVRDPKASDDRGDYRQIFDVMHNYLANEFGEDWLTQAKYAPDPADPDMFVLRVSMETLHIHVAQQTPPEKEKEQGPHYGFIGVDEFSVNDGPDYRKMAGIEGVLRGVAGQGAVDMLDSVIASGANRWHGPRMVKKVGLLAVLRNPHNLNWKDVLQTYPLRDDPVVRARLTKITTDGRYDTTLQEKAKEVLDDKVTEEELISVGL